jgi:signal transduction histidine kinase
VATTEGTGGNAPESAGPAVGRAARARYEEVAGRIESLSTRSARLEATLDTLTSEVRSPLAAAQGLLRLAVRRAARGVEATDERTVADLDDADAAVSEAVDLVGRQLDAVRVEARALVGEAREVERLVEALGAAIPQQNEPGSGSTDSTSPPSGP